MDRDSTFSLAKVVLTMAWADGTFHKEEKRILDNLLRKLPQLSERDLMMLRLYMEYPITEEETDAIRHEFRNLCKTPDDRDFALKILMDVLQADGETDQRERALYEKIEADLSQSDGVFGKLKNIFSSTNTVAPPQREQQLAAYVENPIFFLLKKYATADEIEEIGSLEKLENITLFGAIIAAIVQADDDVSPAEAMVLTAGLMNHWKISRKTAEKITKLILAHYVTEKDLIRYCHNFLTHHGDDQILKLFSMLVAIIKADGTVLPEENEMLCFIAGQLKIDPAFVGDNIPEETR